MAWHSLNRVQIVTGGVPVQAIATRYPCQTVFFQTIQSNIGKLYIMDSATGNRLTGAGVLAMIPAPTLVAGVAVILPWASVTVASAPAALDASKLWIDADNSGEYVQISAVRN